MNNVKVTIDSSAFNKWLATAPDKVGTAIQNLIYKVTLMVERQAKIGSPVDTGRLRSSISTSIRPMNASVSTHVNYARFIHDGTRHMRARPFMTRAAESVQGQISGLVQEELKALD